MSSGKAAEVTSETLGPPPAKTEVAALPPAATRESKAQASTSEATGPATGAPATAVPATSAPTVSLTPPNAGGDGARAAILLPLSGPRAGLGRAMLNAAQMALFEIADSDFTLLPFDTKGTAEGAAAAAEQALANGAQLILGPLLAASVRATAPIARAGNVSIVAFSNSREVAGDGVYILGFVPRQQVETITTYAVDQGLYRFAALVPDNAYGRASVEALQRTAAANAATVVKIQYYDPTATDFSAAVKAIDNYDARRRTLLDQRAELEARGDEISRQALKRLEKLDTIGDVNFDAVLLPAGGQNLRTLASLLSYYDVDQPAVRLLGLRSWDDSQGISAEPALARAWFAAPPRAEQQKFAARYKANFGHQPVRLASLAYDATALAAILAQSSSAADFSPHALTNSLGFLGIDGLFRLRPDGVAERKFAVLEVRRKGFQVRRSATTSFQRAKK